MKYLVKTINHDTGEVFRDVVRLKENETYEVVEADSKEEAEKIASRPKGLLEVVSSSFNNNPISEVLKVRRDKPRKDSE